MAACYVLTVAVPGICSCFLLLLLLSAVLLLLLVTVLFQLMLVYETSKHVLPLEIALLL